jgi:aerobic carbon-monoxide dehydrogenase small subunit
MSETSVNISFTVNGSVVTQPALVRQSLADFIREDLGLTGTHLGCEHGVCGACTVLVDGAAARSCLMLAVQADGTSITTIEGLTNADGTLSPLQQAFMDHHGFQCAFCAPGFLLTAQTLVDDGKPLDRDHLRAELSGNLCRCTGYHSILDSMEAALAAARGDSTSNDPTSSDSTSSDSKSGAQ